MAPLPIVLCGLTETITAAFRKAMLPEYDVIHIVRSVESAISDIPLLLSSQTPPNSSSNGGSQNYTKPPVAVALGGGFDDEMFSKIQNACENAPSIPWMRTDMSKKPDALKSGMRKPDEMTPEEMEWFGTWAAERLKEKLRELKIGEEGGVREGVFWF